ncbi:VapC toxin family PIN domain ribonuclease [Sphingorhabdus lutea]|uniref:VapC toxin family PIN domain ribonuclease n=1 Tax=Sphingorhabdus lutea TaxID=1913578 RepID=A0A1L3JAU0_9SPHN|nr:PIN domain-containing protein [Sphingorhabdus lutea]APG62255.1 VapC toxin family PIN domain ribonuclease [Sphingorhabdus lutea]
MSAPFFDSDILTDWLRGVPSAKQELSRYAQHRMSRICWTELMACEPLETRRNLQKILYPIEVVEVDARIADAAATIMYRNNIALQRAIILATAQVNGSILITRNIKDFSAEMPGIRIPYKI